MAISNTSRTRNFGAGSPAGASVAAYGPYWNAELDLLYANDVELQSLIDSITVTADNSVQLTGAQTAAGAKTWSDAAVFESTARIDGAADLNSTLDVQGAANFQSTAAFTGETTHTGEIQANGGIDIASSQVVRYNNKPVAGWLDDGTPYFIKLVTSSIPNGSGTLDAAHGLGSVATNGKVLSVNVIMQEPGGSWQAPSAPTSSAIPRNVYIDDTNVSMFRGAATNTQPVKFIIKYIL